MSPEWLKYAPAPLPLKDGEAWNVFLSYRSVNRRWVINLYDVLVGVGHKVFIDQLEIAAGNRLRKSIGAALQRSHAGVLVWSTDAADSQWVEDEQDIMLDEESKRGMIFVPIRLDNKPLPPFAAQRVYLDFTSYPDGPNGGELIRLLHTVVGKPLSEDAMRFAAEQDEAAEEALHDIEAARESGNAKRLLDLFQSGGPSWDASAALGARIAEALTKLDSPEQAIEVCEVLEQRFPRAIRPKQMQALALARLGRLEEAQLLLGKLYAAGHKDPETLGIYARTYFDAYEATGKRLMLEKSRDLYAEAFEGARDDYYTGINAAAKSVFLGTDDDIARARELAQNVEAIVGKEPVLGDYWKSATVAEAQLIEQDYDAAGRLYARAVAVAPNEIGSHRSTWRQAKRLMDAMTAPDEKRLLINRAFSHLEKERRPT